MTTIDVALNEKFLAFIDGKVLENFVSHLDTNPLRKSLQKEVRVSLMI